MRPAPRGSCSTTSRCATWPTRSSACASGAPQTVIEASGGVSLDRIRDISKTGVDVISVGALTHSARAINYSCEIRPVDGSQSREPSRRRSDAGRRRSRRRRGWPPRLGTRWLGRAFEWHAACGSTNDLAAERAREGAAAGLVIAADAQTAGRGRLGRTWHSPAGDNLYLSILLRPTRPPSEIPPLTLLAGAAVARALAALGLAPRLKWPNDVELVDDEAGRRRKVAGILTEMATRGRERAARGGRHRAQRQRPRVPARDRRARDVAAAGARARGRSRRAAGRAARARSSRSTRSSSGAGRRRRWRRSRRTRRSRRALPGDRARAPRAIAWKGSRSASTRMAPCVCVTTQGRFTA